MLDAASVEAVLAKLVPTINAHRIRTSRVFVLAVSGLQGSGKTTWAAHLAERLTADHGLVTKAVSLDDFYLDHDELVDIREANPSNQLLQTRGQPGTHDEMLADNFFNSITQADAADLTVRWPAYDKSLHQGQGGRVPVESWASHSRNEPLHVLIFEGWCVGFQPLAAEELHRRWERSFARGPSGSLRSVNTLQQHSLEHLGLLNEHLKLYCELFMGPWRFDSLVQLATDDLSRTYDWRLGQEAARIKAGGVGMSSDEVVRFVRGYMPAYELYLDQLSAQSVFAQEDNANDKKHIQLFLDSHRNVTAIKML